jgi:hypothetical protein
LGKLFKPGGFDFIGAVSHGISPSGSAMIGTGKPILVVKRLGIVWLFWRMVNRTNLA